MIVNRSLLSTYVHQLWCGFLWLNNEPFVSWIPMSMLYTMHNLFNFALNAGDNSHQAVMDYWNAIFTPCYRLSSNPYTYLFFPYCTYGVSWDQRFVSDCWLESVHSLVFHFEMNEHEWLSLKRTRDWNKRKKKNLTIECWMTTSNRRKNVNDNWRII